MIWSKEAGDSFGVPRPSDPPVFGDTLFRDIRDLCFNIAFRKATQHNNITRWWFQIFFFFHPYLGKISILTSIFQMGWNHQQVLLSEVVAIMSYLATIDQWFPQSKIITTNLRWDQDYVVSLSNDQMGLSRIDLGVAPSEILNVAADPGTERCKKHLGCLGRVGDYTCPILSSYMEIVYSKWFLFFRPI